MSVLDSGINRFVMVNGISGVKDGWQASGKSDPEDSVSTKYIQLPDSS